MNPVASLLTIDGIALNVDAPSRKRAFEELAHLFEKNAGIPHREAYDDLVAIPHGRIQGLDKIVVAILRTKTPVVFDTPDNRRARLFFGILIPANDEEHYLPVLSTVAALLKDRDIKDKLLNETEPVAICQTISDFVPQEWPADSEEETQDLQNSASA